MWLLRMPLELGVFNYNYHCQIYRLRLIIFKFILQQWYLSRDQCKPNLTRCTKQWSVKRNTGHEFEESSALCWAHLPFWPQCLEWWGHGQVHYSCFIAHSISHKIHGLLDRACHLLMFFWKHYAHYFMHLMRQKQFSCLLDEEPGHQKDEVTCLKTRVQVLR